MINGLFFLRRIISHVINVLVIQQVHIGTVFDFQAVSLVKTLTRLLTYMSLLSAFIVLLTKSSNHTSIFSQK